MPGWKVKDSVSGDLNKDGRRDLALILEYADSVVETDANGDRVKSRPRILLIMFRDSGSNNYSLMVHQNQFILRAGEVYPSRDSYEGMEIDHGVLRINFDFVRGFQTYKFRWQKGDFYLIGLCIHGQTRIVKKNTGNGRLCLRVQELSCGISAEPIAWTSSKFFI